MNLKVDLAGVTLNNPIMTASGTFGSGEEYSEFVDLNRLGAVVTKGVANVPWEGNPTPRVAEVYGGMLNAIGLQNPGIDLFVERDIPFLTQFDTKIIVNVCGRTTEDYCEVVERLSDQPVDMLRDQHLLSECQRGRNCFWSGSKSDRGNYKRDQKACKTAGDHEAQPECDGHHRDGKSGRSRRCRCVVPDQYINRNEDQHSQPEICTGK